MSTIYGFIIDPHNDQLSVILIAQLVEHYTGIAEVSVRVPFRSEIFRLFFRYRLSSIAKLPTFVSGQRENTGENFFVAFTIGLRGYFH